MIASTSLIFSAITENQPLQRAFCELLNGPAVTSDIMTLLNDVRLRVDIVIIIMVISTVSRGLNRSERSVIKHGPNHETL